MEQVKVEPIDLSSPLAAKVKRQLEYYFGDVNYPKDKWMRAKAAENNGFIPIEVLLTFNRLKEITSDINLVTAVLKTIPDLEIVDDKVKRLKPIPDTFDHKARADCTVLLRGFTKGEPMVSIDEITEIMLPIANPISIFRKRTKRKEFKGKVLVQFSTPEEAKKALDVKEVNLKDQKISIMTQEQYFQMKTEELAKKGIVYQKPMSKRPKEKTDNSARKSKKQKKEEIKEEVPTGPQMVIGVLIEIKNVPQGIPFEDLKAYFARFGTVLFIDLSKIEQNIILARFSNPSETKDAFAEISEKKMEINNNVLDARMVTGEEEEKYWKEEIIPQMLRSQAKKNNYRNKTPSNRKKNNKRQKTFSNNNKQPEEKKETEKVTNE